LTSLVLYFPLDGGAVLPMFFVPGEGLKQREARDHVPYRIWHDKGLIELTNGRTIDKKAVALRLAEVAGEFDLRGVGYDRWRIKDLQRILEEEGISSPLIEFGQGFKDMGPALDALETAVLDGALQHGQHPVLAWNCSNAVVDIDPAGNRKLSKARSIARIDGMTALAMAIGLYTRGAEQLGFNFDENSIMVPEV
jgi:phage terminase large subunit-like protein